MDTCMLDVLEMERLLVLNLASCLSRYNANGRRILVTFGGMVVQR